MRCFEERLHNDILMVVQEGAWKPVSSNVDALVRLRLYNQLEVAVEAQLDIISHQFLAPQDYEDIFRVKI